MMLGTRLAAKFLSFGAMTGFTSNARSILNACFLSPCPYNCKCEHSRKCKLHSMDCTDISAGIFSSFYIMQLRYIEIATVIIKYIT